MKQVIIYAFRSPGSGAVYIGKHECDPTSWPRRGTGKLPDGYGGKGVVVPRFHAKHGDRVQWRILAVVALEDWPRAERRAVDLARAIFGRKCVNQKDGGDGNTRADALRMWADPEYVGKVTSAQKDAQNRPEVRAKVISAQKEAMSRPEVQRRKSAAQRAVWADPGYVAKMSIVLARATAIRSRKARARKALRPFAVPPIITYPGVRVWIHHPDLPLGIGGPR
jgi:hypothetical protein